MTLLPAQPLKSLVCMNAVMELFPHQVVVHRRGLFSSFSLSFHGKSQTIALDHILELRLYPANLFNSGVLRLITRDGNIWLFFGGQANRRVLEMKDAIEDLLSRRQVFPERQSKLRSTG